MTTDKTRQQRCSTCGRVMPPGATNCSYCLRDEKELSKKLTVPRLNEEEKPRWIPWGIAGVIGLFLFWLLDLLLHFVDNLLKGRY